MQLSTDASLLDEIDDEVLRERLSRLGSAPLDTMIRDAGVILEDRLRAVGGFDSTRHGTDLVDGVLNPSCYRPHYLIESWPR